METCIWCPEKKKDRPELKAGMQITLQKGEVVLVLHASPIVPLPGEPQGKEEEPWKIRQTLPDEYSINLSDITHVMQDYKSGLAPHSPSFYERVATLFFFSDKTYYVMDRGTYVRYREKSMKDWLWEPRILKKGHPVTFNNIQFTSMHNALLVDGDLEHALKNLKKNKNITWMHLLFFLPSSIKSQHVSGSKLTLKGCRKQNESVVWGLSDGSKTALVSFAEWQQIIRRKPESGVPHLCLTHEAH